MIRDDFFPNEFSKNCVIGANIHLFYNIYLDRKMCYHWNRHQNSILSRSDALSILSNLDSSPRSDTEFLENLSMKPYSGASVLATCLVEHPNLTEITLRVIKTPSATPVSESGVQPVFFVKKVYFNLFEFLDDEDDVDTLFGWMSIDTSKPYVVVNAGRLHEALACLSSDDENWKSVINYIDSTFPEYFSNPNFEIVVPTIN